MSELDLSNSHEQRPQLTRSEKRFTRDLNQLNETRNRLIDEGRFSLEQGLGRLVIIVSTDPDYNFIRDWAAEGKKYTHRDVDDYVSYQKRAFIEEGEKLTEAYRRNKTHQEVNLKTAAYSKDIELDIQDPEVTDMILIGHGSIGCFRLNGGGNLDWKDLANMNRRRLLNKGHLKQGNFIQRTCGTFSKLTVPLGASVALDLTLVIAPAGETVADVHPDEQLFKPVFSSNENFIDQVIDLNTRFSHQNKKS